MIQTRLATIADLSEVAELFDNYRQFYEQAPDLLLATEFIRERLEKEQSAIILAETDEVQPIGFCQMYPSFCSLTAAPIYILYDLFVHPRSRRSGAGKALLKAAQDHSLKNGFVRIDLSTAKTNRGAQNLYEELGWQRDEIFYVYTKVLRAPAVSAEGQHDH
jgi:ribosomal protein S18 acetylase RimI-like enzyme